MVFTLGLRHTFARLATGAGISTISRSSDSLASFRAVTKNPSLADSGQMLSQFRETLAEIPTAGLTFDAGTAANANLRMISVTRDEARTVTPADIATFLRQAADCFAELLPSSCPDAHAIFYAWVDQMAGQLRFSVVSSIPPPFRCSIRIVSEPEIVAQHFLDCPNLDGIPILSLEATDPSSLDSSGPTVESHALDVFVTQIPRRNA